MSLRQRLLTLLTSGIGVLLGCGPDVLLELHNDKARTVQDLKSTTDLIGTNEAGALENIRRAIEKRPVETATGPIAVSMSLGVAGTEDWQDLNAKQLIKEADVALYRAKEWGRNRAVLAKPSGLSEIRAAKVMQHPVSAV
jgi:GGDEF domain-containing protein